MSTRYEWAVFLVGLSAICLVQALTPWPWMLLFIPLGGVWGHFANRITRFVFARKGEQQ